MMTALLIWSSLVVTGEELESLGWWECELMNACIDVCM